MDPPPDSPAPEQPEPAIDTVFPRAFAPLIGVILMVAITVILAAILGTFMIDISNRATQAGPTTSLGITDANHHYNPSANDQDLIVIDHQAGESLNLATARITMRRLDNNEHVLTWTGWTGIDGTNTKGSSGDWTIEYNGEDITAGASQTMVPGDVIVISANAADLGGNTALPDIENYRVIVTGSDASSPIAVTTVELR